MKKIKMPNTLILMFSVLVLMAALTWIIPGGKYQREIKDGREIVVSDSYQPTKAVGQGIGQILKAPVRGFINAAQIIGLILIVGGAFTIVQKTGAVDALIHTIARAYEHSRLMRILLIPVIMFTFSTFGSVFGMSEEVIPFILIFVPLAISLGYDSITGVAIPFVGAATGFSGAFMNPFTVGIAQGIAELPLFSGMGYRLVVWLIVTSVAVVFVMLYARYIRKHPQKSRTWQIDQYWRDYLAKNNDNNPDMQMTNRHHIVLAVFALAIVVLISGVIIFKWYINEIAAVFLGMGIIAGLVSHLSVNQLAEEFVAGARDFTGVAFIVTLSRAILVIATDGQIIDSILHAMSGLVQGAHPVITAQLMFVVQSVIHFFVPSGSGQAALVMPVMAPLSDILGVTRQTAVLAFQLGDGFNSMIIPTSGVTMGILGVAKIPYEKWFMWILPLQVILFVLSLLFLIPPVLMHWGPF
jgi:uncharacterized ion transporter superfamily protein YfcC